MTTTKRFRRQDVIANVKRAIVAARQLMDYIRMMDDDDDDNVNARKHWNELALGLNQALADLGVPRHQFANVDYVRPEEAQQGGAS